jgi:hypothetical protein
MADVDMYTDSKIMCILGTLKLRSLRMKLVDRIGQVFGKLTVLEQAGRNNLKKVLWRCQCECGQEILAVSGSLVTGNTKSCGCIGTNFKHGGTGKGSYNTWRAMMRRCYNVNDKDFEKYGALGVSVYAPWHDYLVFALAMGEPFGDETLDRIDVYGDYTPTNCRWATPTVQSRNLRIRKTTASGFTGVHLRGSKWYAEITAKKKKFYSGACSTVEEAAAARKELERLHWGAA